MLSVDHEGSSGRDARRGISEHKAMRDSRPSLQGGRNIKGKTHYGSKTRRIANKM